MAGTNKPIQPAFLRAVLVVISLVSVVGIAAGAIEVRLEHLVSHFAPLANLQFTSFVVRLGRVVFKIIQLNGRYLRWV